MLPLLVACTAPKTTDGPGEVPHTPSLARAPALLAGPTPVRPDSDSVRLVQRLTATTDRPCRLSVVLDDGIRARRISWEALATEFDAPLLALHADTTYDVVATFTDEAGGAVQASTSFDTGALFPELPQIELRSSTEGALEPGYTALPVEFDGLIYVLAVDPQGAVVWAWSGASEVKSLTFRDGVFGALLNTSAIRWDPLGDVLGLWVPADFVDQVVDYAPIPLPVEGLNHEVAFQDDGSFWSFYKVQRTVDNYPTSVVDPSLVAPALVDDDHVIHVAADGALLSDWSMMDRLDPVRISFSSLDINSEHQAFDWGHGNAIVPLPDEDAVLVSLRHQDVVVKLTGADGTLKWILGNHDGWDPALVPYLLTPVGAPFAWQYHQHAPMVGMDGRVTLFDNGNDDRTTPYSQLPDPDGLYSRLVQFDVDEAAGTVRQAWMSYGDPGRLYGQALGNADLQPLTGDVLGTWAYLHEEDGQKNVDLGRGNRSVRVIEVTAGGDVVWDLDLWVPVDTDQDGLLTDRAIRIPTLYGPGVKEEWL